MKNCYLDGYMEQAKKYVLNVNPYAVGRAEDIEKLSRMGCHALILDRPDNALAVLANIQ